MAKQAKAKWVQNGSRLTLTAEAPRKHRRPAMMYSVEFNYQLRMMDTKGYSRKQKHKNKDD